MRRTRRLIHTHERVRPIARPVNADEISRPTPFGPGITLDPGTEIWAKRPELLKEGCAFNYEGRFFGMREGWEGEFAGRLRISVVSMLPMAGTPSEIERVFAEIAKDRPAALLIT